MSWLTDFFRRADLDAPIDSSRRRIVKGAAGLAAVAAVVSVGGYRLLTETESEKLAAMVKRGLVEGQTFLLDRTAVLDGLRGVVIRNCEFIAAPNFDGSCLLEFRNSLGCLIDLCSFRCGGITSAIMFDHV